MGKKRCRKTYHSKGQRNSVASNVTAMVRKETPLLDKALNILAAWRAGKNPWVTIKNPDNQQKNRPFIKVRANSYYGNYKNVAANLFKG